MHLFKTHKLHKYLRKMWPSSPCLQFNFLGLILLSPMLSLSNHLPPSTLSNGMETYLLDCPNNPQRTTPEMNECNANIINQLKKIEDKYIAAIYARINADYKEEPELLNELLTAIEKENKTRDELINSASSATYTYWKGGTIRGLMGTGRKIELIKYRIHNQWQNWLTYMDSSPAILLEPLFINKNN